MLAEDGRSQNRSAAVADDNDQGAGTTAWLPEDEGCVPIRT